MRFFEKEPVIMITDEMLELADAAYVNSPDMGRPAMDAALKAAFEIVERDYTIIRNEPPAEVNAVKDRDNDSWLRLSDGRWICTGATGLIYNTVSEIRETHGPVSW